MGITVRPLGRERLTQRKDRFIFSDRRKKLQLPYI